MKNYLEQKDWGTYFYRYIKPRISQAIVNKVDVEVIDTLPSEALTNLEIENLLT